MRRSLIVYLCGAISVLIMTGVFSWIDYKNIDKRYHQHLEQPSENELGVCGVCDGKKLCTHLPVISIDTGDLKIPGGVVENEAGEITFETSDNGEDQITVSLYTVDKEGVWHHADDNPTHMSQALFRIRGNSSRWFDKPSYRVQLIKKDSPDEENYLPLLGMTSGSEWALHGPFLDKTLMRNYVWMNLSAEVMGYAPNVRFCELILNGQYQGVYLLMETITVQDGRVELTKYKDGDSVMSYLIRLDNNVNPDKLIYDFASYTKRHEKESDTEIIYPGLSRQTEGVQNYIKTDLSEIEKTIYSLDMIRDSGVYQYLIDIDSFVDYYILQEFLAVNDAMSRSTYFYKDVRGKLTIGPVWDYNNAFDNFLLPMPRNEFILTQRLWYGQLMMDKDFVEQVIKRWHELRRYVLSEERLLSYCTEVELWLGNAVERNFETWSYSFDPDNLSINTRRRPGIGDKDLTIYDVNPSSFSEAMNWMLDYMTDRGRWLDDHIESLRQYCHPSRKATLSLD